ncbi:exosortase E/protease, VPEID-CTERM system [Actibacterium ureilyticum]|uniref:exosortase E/protease, VPEID-CTERM system n=1 Tax=Actibacterium ureilyticum TaxID=1590614 RepID=UPI000BAAF1BB|nr:exosortase E/protease, VPEID-CTERM system [Actibacterium ureilyticum]
MSDVQLSTDTATRPSGRMLWALVALGLVLAELLILSLTYQQNFVFSCKHAAPELFCRFAGRIVPRTLAVLAGLVLFALARPHVIRSLFHTGQIRALTAIAMNLVGFALIMLPWPVISDASTPQMVALAILCWIGGGILCAMGTLQLLSPTQGWLMLIRGHWKTLGALVVFALALPELTDAIQPMWRFDIVADITFDAVARILELLGYDLYANGAEKVIGAGDFLVMVGPKCSGVEGFALISAFVTIYLVLFRDDLRFPRALLLFPIAILTSWLFNILRIAALLMIGFEISPELAIGAFHSHAGWLSFTALSVGLILVSRTVPFFTNQAALAKVPGMQLPPFFQDRSVAELLPFAVFMLTALLASTFSETPGLIYPMRALIMAGVIALFWRVYRALPWRLDPLALGTGVAIAALWIVTAPAATGTPAFGALTGLAFAGWVVARIVGTSLFVPLIEEMMFRGYMFKRIAPSGTGWRMALAVAISAGLFALLHDRWVEAAIAGVIFGLLVWRSRNITDAIVSHASANFLIAVYALLTGAWHII